jgi:hypothetical protein
MHAAMTRTPGAVGLLVASLLVSGQLQAYPLPHRSREQIVADSLLHSSVLDWLREPWTAHCEWLSGFSDVHASLLEAELGLTPEAMQRFEQVHKMILLIRSAFPPVMTYGHPFGDENKRLVPWVTFDRSGRATISVADPESVAEYDRRWDARRHSLREAYEDTLKVDVARADSTLSRPQAQRLRLWQVEYAYFWTEPMGMWRGYARWRGLWQLSNVSLDVLADTGVTWAVASLPAGGGLAPADSAELRRLIRDYRLSVLKVRVEQEAGGWRTVPDTVHDPTPYMESQVRSRVARIVQMRSDLTETVAQKLGCEKHVLDNWIP